MVVSVCSRVSGMGSVRMAVVRERRRAPRRRRSMPVVASAEMLLKWKSPLWPALAQQKMGPQGRGGKKRQVPGSSSRGLISGDACERSCGGGTATGGALVPGQRRCTQAKQRARCGRLGCARRMVRTGEWAHSRVKRASACASLALGRRVYCAGGGRGGAAGAGAALPSYSQESIFSWELSPSGRCVLGHY